MNTFLVDMVTSTGAKLRLHVIARTSAEAVMSVLKTMVRPPRRFAVRVSP